MKKHLLFTGLLFLMTIFSVSAQLPEPLGITGDLELCQNPDVVGYFHADILYADRFVWSVPDGLILHGQNSADVVIEFPSAVGVYEISVYGINGNGNSSSIEESVHIRPTYHAQESQTICQGESYEFCGQNLTTSGVVDCNIGTTYGCDSIITLTLQVDPLPVVQRIIGQTILCQQSVGYYFADIDYATEYQWIVPEGFTLESGQGEATAAIRANDFSSEADLKVVGINYCGTSDTFAMHLTIPPAYYTTLTDETCQGTQYMEDGFFLESAQNDTTLYQHLITQDGCDSVLTLHLTVLPMQVTWQNVDLCQGDTYAFHGQNLTETGNYYTFLEASNGCDSAILLHIDLHPVYHAYQEDVACYGKPYQFGTQTLRESGIYHENFPTNGYHCDSIITLNLTFGYAHYEVVQDYMCEGTEYQFDDFLLTDTGVFVWHYQTLDGCDSIIELVLDWAYPEPPTNVQTTDHHQHHTYQGGQIEITWQGTEGEAYAYDIYRNDEWIARVTDTIFVDTDVVQNHDYCYAVQTVSSVSCFSAPSEVVCEVLTNPNAVFNLFPNPASHELTIVGEEMTQVIFYNESGLVVATFTPDHSEKLVVNISGWGTGIYYALITTQDQTQRVRKFVVAR